MVIHCSAVALSRHSWPYVASLTDTTTPSHTVGLIGCCTWTQIYGVPKTRSCRQLKRDRLQLCHGSLSVVEAISEH